MTPGGPAASADAVETLDQRAGRGSAPQPSTTLAAARAATSNGSYTGLYGGA